VAALVAATAAPFGVAQADLQEGDDLTELSLEDLFEVEVTSVTKQRQTVAEAPAVIAVVTSDDINNLNIQSVAEAVSWVAGMYVSTDFVMYDAGLRGVTSGMRGGSRGIKVMIDGHPVAFRADGASFLGPELIPMNIVERIEVIRGPGSALYGANAFLGVINVITKRAGRLEALQAAGSFGLFDVNPGFDGEVIGGKTIGPLELTAGVRVHQTDRSGLSVDCQAPHCNQDPLLRDRETAHAIERPLSVFVRARVEPEDAGVFDVLGAYQILDVRGGFSDWGLLNYDELTDGEGALDTGNRVALDNLLVAAEYTSPALLDDHLTVGLGARFARGEALDRERLRDTLGYRGSAAAYDASGLFESRDGYGFWGVDVFAQTELTFAFEQAWLQALSVRAAVDFELDRVSLVSDGGQTPNAIGERELMNLGASGQLTAALFERLDLVAGIRVDRHFGAELTATELAGLGVADAERLCGGDTVCYTQLSGRAGAALQLPGSVTVKLVWGSAFKAPTPALLYGDAFIGQRPVNNNPALRPQQVSSFELLIGTSQLDDRLAASVNLFRSEIDDLAEFTRDGIQIRAVNDVPVVSMGVEAEIRARFDPVRVVVSGSFTDSKRQVADDSGQIEDTFGSPNAMVNGIIMVDIPYIETTAAVSARWVGPRVGSFLNRGGDIEANRYELDPYWLLDVDVVTEPLELFDGHPTQFAVGVKNLLGQRYEFPGYQPFYRVDTPGRPRILLATIRQSFDLK